MNWQDLPNAPSPGTPLCQLDDIPDGAARMLTVGDSAPPFPVLLLRSEATVFAYLNRCAHFGVPLAQQQQHLRFTPHRHVECNVHYARYNWQDGRCESGECAGEHLVPLPTEIIDGMVYLGTGSA